MKRDMKNFQLSSKKNNCLRLTCINQRNIMKGSKQHKLHNCSCYVIAVSSYRHRQEWYTRDSNTICSSGSQKTITKNKKIINFSIVFFQRKQKKNIFVQNPRALSKCDLIDCHIPIMLALDLCDPADLP